MDNYDVYAKTALQHIRDGEPYTYNGLVRELADKLSQKRADIKAALEELFTSGAIHYDRNYHVIKATYRNGKDVERGRAEEKEMAY